MRNTKSDEPTLSEKILALYSKDGSRGWIDGVEHLYAIEITAVLMAELISAVREQNSSLQSITSALTQLQR